MAEEKPAACADVDRFCARGQERSHDNRTSDDHRKQIASPSCSAPVSCRSWHRSDAPWITLDIQLPVLDGYEATRRIKADPALHDIPVIAVTSYALSGDEAKTRDAGRDAYIAKPFSPRQLLGKVRELLP